MKGGMAMKKIILITVLALMIIVSGCDSEQAPEEEVKGVFLGGTEGITAKFEPFGVSDEGVYTIFDVDTFPIDITLQNKGEYDVKASEVTVKLLGPSKEEFEGISSWEVKNKETIEKKSNLNTNGGEESINLASDAKFKGKVTTLLDRQWFANIEYRYQTSLILPEVCLKEDLADKRVCDPTGEKKFFVSGSPVTVTKVEESTAGKGIMALRIAVEKMGTGKVTLPDKDFAANSEKIAYTVDDAAWECKSGGKVGEARIVQNKAEIVCKLKTPLTEDTLATKKISLTLDFKYRDIIEEKLRIKEGSN